MNNSTAALTPAQQQRVIDMMTARCASLQAIWEAAARENSQLRRDLQNSDLLRNQCACSLGRLASQAVSGASPAPECSAKDEVVIIEGPVEAFGEHSVRSQTDAR